jgi:hypothetical protein
VVKDAVGKIHRHGIIMTPKTLKALRESIAHWDRLAAGKERKGEKPNSQHCALCALFHSDGCDGCPVRKRTGVPYCIKTPFRNAFLTFNTVLFQSHALKELEFLKSLLPKRK